MVAAKKKGKDCKRLEKGGREKEEEKKAVRYSQGALGPTQMSSSPLCQLLHRQPQSVPLQVKSAKFGNEKSAVLSPGGLQKAREPPAQPSQPGISRPYSIPGGQEFLPGLQQGPASRLGEFLRHEEGRVSEKWAYLAVQTGTDLISATPAARHTSCPISPHASLCLAALKRTQCAVGCGVLCRGQSFPP